MYSTRNTEIHSRLEWYGIVEFNIRHIIAHFGDDFTG